MKNLFFLALSIIACQSHGMEQKKCSKQSGNFLRTWRISLYQPYAFVKAIGKLEKALYKHTALTLLTSSRIDHIMQTQEPKTQKKQKISQELLRLKTSFQKVKECYNRCEKYIVPRALQEILDILKNANDSLEFYSSKFNV